MMARRGQVKRLMSDNGSNFVGANRALQSILKSLFISKEFQSDIMSYLTDQGIEWTFIPPSSPYKGGIWEAGVKSFKSHFKRVVGSLLITAEEMHTLLTLIESCLNSRPITPMSSDPNDLEPLTAGHFLIELRLRPRLNQIFKISPTTGFRVGSELKNYVNCSGSVGKRNICQVCSNETSGRDARKRRWT
jgi:hypothetical protein